MKITNKDGLPAPFVRAVENDPYDNGGSDFTATSLVIPSRIWALEREYRDQLEVEASSRVAVTLGQAMHKICERAARPLIDIIEKRFFFKIGHYTVSAQVDLFETDTGTLYDWKCTKTYPFTRSGGGGVKAEWEQQLNIGKVALELSGLIVKKLSIIGILKDFDSNCLDYSSRHYSPGYPKFEVVEAEQRIWTPSEAANFIGERINSHVRATRELPRCTPQEAWGGRRCAKYCQVSKFCTQYQSAKQTGRLT